MLVYSWAVFLDVEYCVVNALALLFSERNTHEH